MGELSIYHWLVVLAVLLLLFGGRKIPQLMSSLGHGIRMFEEGLSGKRGRSPDSFANTRNEGEKAIATKRDLG